MVLRWRPIGTRTAQNDIRRNRKEYLSLEEGLPVEIAQRSSGVAWELKWVFTVDRLWEIQNRDGNGTMGRKELRWEGVEATTTLFYSE